MGEKGFPTKEARREKIITEVDKILELLRLTKVADSPIMMCSGGEKKRVNIGTELITNPSIIMLDEPTSGLDSASSVSLLNVLKDLARNHGKTIITSIHQPNSATFLNTFDKLLLLSDGNVVYFGKPTESLDYLKTIDLACPEGCNAADHWMDLLVLDPTTDSSSSMKESPKYILQKAWDNDALAAKMEAYRNSINRLLLSLTTTATITKKGVSILRPGGHNSQHCFTDPSRKTNRVFSLR